MVRRVGQITYKVYDASINIVLKYHVKELSMPIAIGCISPIFFKVLGRVFLIDRRENGISGRGGEF
jgi:hypothetical protein|tara:strand:+ start:1409 stop:1606 length:198 start_codon:yes stop_codon:yes gene_type:complete